ncbi:MAG: InlB B-repeat-containing protein [Eggerthellaceae bacterium]|nr:InlB B-repeat-containing protein [Eggerthellaceae bacterium]
MKNRIIAIVMALALCFGSAFCIAGCDLINGDDPSTYAKSIVDKQITSDLHLIVTYYDGTKEDLGYVGVETERIIEVLPRLCVVTFVGMDEQVIGTTFVYKGLDAQLPDTPNVEGKTFAGWLPEPVNVQEDMICVAQYTDPSIYTVIFKDDQGNEIKNQKVISGKSATAPTAAQIPKRTTTIFDHWDGDFTNVNSDLVINAVYRPKVSYTVTFNDYNGLTLGSTTVLEENNATAPVTPSRQGYTFTGWSPSINGVTRNLTVTAQYSIVKSSNIIDIAYQMKANNTVDIIVSVKGNVKFAGIEGEIVLPSGLTFVSKTDSSTATCKTLSNNEGNTIYFSATTSTGQNVTTDTQLMTITCTYGSASSYTVGLTVTDAYDQNMANVTYSVIGKTIVVRR